MNHRPEKAAFLGRIRSIYRTKICFWFRFESENLKKIEQNEKNQTKSNQKNSIVFP